jgi:uncharacterized protein (TIGR02271 family)
MANTVVGVYDDYSRAQSALDELSAAGFSRGDLQLTPAENTAIARQTSLGDTQLTGEHPSGGSAIGNFFRSLFGSDESSERSGLYSEAMRRGSYLLIVTTEADAQSDRAAEIMQHHDPVDIDERAAHWRSQGWTGFDRSASIMSDDEIARDRSAYASMPATGERQQMPAGAAGEARIPVVEEQLKVGKREVSRGGVRIFQRVSEQPVEESVQLREEQVKVERHAVDQPATAADMDAFKEGSVEVRATAEEPVIEKTARVIEEVVVSKEVSDRTETISDTVRRTEVEVEPMAAQAGTAGTAIDDTDFRSHWQREYSQAGGRYDDYASAYRYGSTLAGDQNNKGARWDDVEPRARRDWESRNSGSPWDKVKGSIRYAWEKVAR